METRFFIVQCLVEDISKLEAILGDDSVIISFAEVPLDMVTETLENCGLDEYFEY